MLVSSDRRYRFDVSPAELWRQLCAVDQYQRWWPWLRRLEADALRVGEVWTCVVQPPLPYRLRFHLSIDEVEPLETVAATVTGDIVGTARLRVRPRGGGSELHLVSSLAPRSPALKMVARAARPVAQMGHDWVIDTGIRQLRARALGPPAA